MEQNQASQLIATYGGRFPDYALPNIVEQLKDMDFAEGSMRMALTKDPTIALIISIFIGQFGVDRILIGDTGLGIAKLLTCGGLGIWTIIDWFLIMGATKEKNYAKFNGINNI